MKLLSFADVHAPFLFYLEDGRPVIMDEIVQYRTYRTLLLGLPSSSRVPNIIEQAEHYASEHFGTEPEPQVLQPELMDYEQVVETSRLSKDGTRSRTEDAPQRITGKRLPLITCIASLQCPVSVKPPEGTGMFSKSIATVVWFQEKFGPPQDIQLQRMRMLAWETIAIDVSD